MHTTRWWLAGLCSCALVAANALAADENQPNPNQPTPPAQRDVTIDTEEVDVQVTREGQQTGQAQQTPQSQQTQPSGQETAEQLKQRAEQRAQEAKDLAQRAKQAAEEARQLSQRAERMHGGTPNTATAVEPRERRAYRAGTQPVRSSNLQDMEIRNTQGEDLGSVEDLVIDPQNGKVRYAIVAFGGWFGIGDEKVAIPWDAMQLQASADDGEHQLLLDRTKQQLENAPKVEGDSWFEDNNQLQRVDTFYGARRTVESPATR